jgi:hypothetical protein
MLPSLLPPATCAYPFSHSLQQSVTSRAGTRGAAASRASLRQVAETMLCGRRWSKPACTAARCIRSVLTKLLAVVPTLSCALMMELWRLADATGHPPSPSKTTTRLQRLLPSVLILRFRDGQLGQGTVYECSVPLAVAGLASRKIKQVACGGMHTLLLDEAGKLLAFGSGANGRLGLGNTTTIAKPAEITALASVTAKSIACGWSSR